MFSFSFLIKEGSSANIWRLSLSDKDKLYLTREGPEDNKNAECTWGLGVWPNQNGNCLVGSLNFTLKSKVALTRNKCTCVPTRLHHISGSGMMVVSMEGDSISLPPWEVKPSLPPSTWVPVQDPDPANLFWILQPTRSSLSLSWHTWKACESSNCLWNSLRNGDGTVEVRGGWAMS